MAPTAPCELLPPPLRCLREAGSRLGGAYPTADEWGTVPSAERLEALESVLLGVERHPVEGNGHAVAW